MANQLVLTGPSSLRWSSNEGLLSWGDYLVGYTDKRFAMVRYAFSIDTPLTKLSLKFTDEPNGYIFSHYGGVDYRGDQNSSDFGFYISRKDHKITSGFTESSLGLPGMTDELSGSLKFEDKKYKVILGELDLSKTPLTSGEYYLYIHSYTKQYGCMRWSARISEGNYKPPASESTYESYTNPSAPDGFQFDGNILSTGFTVKWGSAQGGSNNPVDGYEIFLNSTLVSTLDKDSTSYTHTFTADYQGKEIRVSIRSVGEQEIAQYSELTELVGIVNTCPTAPSISKEHTGDGVYQSGTVKLKPTSHDADGDSLTYQYKVNEGTWTNLVNDLLEYQIKEDTIFSFRANDGKENGNESAMQVKCYESLTISENSVISYGERIESVYYKTSARCVAYSNIKDKKFVFEAETEKQINFIAEFGLNQEIELTFYPLDANEEEIRISGEAFPTKSVKTPQQPDQSNIIIYDQWADECVLDKQASQCAHFYKKIRIKIPKFDSRIENWDSFILFDKEQKAATKIDNNDGYLRFQAEFSSVSDTTAKKLLIKFGNAYEIDLGEISRIINFPFQNLKILNDGAIVYDIKDLSVSFGNNTVNDLKNFYGIDDSCSWTMIVQHENASISSMNLTSYESDNNDNKTLTWTDFITEENLKALNIESETYYGQKQFNISVGVTNLYGETAWAAKQCTRNFEKIPEIEAFSFQLNIGNALSTPVIGFQFIEGMNIQFTYKIKKWTKKDVSMSIYSNEWGKLLYGFIDESENSLDGTSSIVISNFTMPQILGKSEKWNLLLSGGGASRAIGSSYDTYPINPKSLTLSGFEYNAGKYILKGYQLSPDKEGAIAEYLEIGEQSYEITNNIAEPPNKDPLDGKDFIYGKLKIQETVTNFGYTLVKVWTSNTVVIYNIVPTVSYRKNHLGINTLSPSEREDSIIYVGSYGKRDKLYFVNSENQARTIDIETGGINGFIVDCGSWTGIPGGLVPTNPDLPVGLATIAYTGDIKDLEQKTETIIILSGGSSEI